MAQADLSGSFHEIRHPTTVLNQVLALKHLKHNIIGHDRWKELAICHGVVVPLVENLKGRFSHGEDDEEENREGGVRTSGEASERGTAWERDGEREAEVRFESLQVITSLAHGGLAFVFPLMDGGVIPPLLSTLSPSSHSPLLILNALRALNAIAEACSTDIISLSELSPMPALANQLYSKPAIDHLVDILAQRARTPVVYEQLTLVMKIISHTLRLFPSGQHQMALVKAGILDSLASRLASLVADMGYASHQVEPSFISTLPPPPKRTSLVHLLEALAAITQNSAYKSLRFLCSPNLLRIFPIAAVAQEHQAAGENMSFAQQTPQTTATNPLDLHLPKLQAVQSKNEHNFSKAFPALGSLVTPGDLSRMPYFNESQAAVSSRTISADEFGSPLIGWLILIARKTTGLERLSALELLTHMISALDKYAMECTAESTRNRDRVLAFLVVPLLVAIIEETRHADGQPAKISGFSDSSISRQVKERAPVALAALVEDSPMLQKAAVDANAIKLLCHMLKKSFDPVTMSKKAMWMSAHDKVPLDLEGDKTCSLGPAPLAPEAVHSLKCRAAALKALAAIAQREDSHRKSVIENGVVACVVDSLAPYTEDGSLSFVIIEACRLATALSRSVSILRTSLIDGGVAKPVFALLKSSDKGVREAATDTITNLILHFSPMRDELVSQGILKILCTHAHSSDAKMRVSSLWALKHLANSAPNDVKKSIIEELGASWLLQTMSGESTSSSSHRSHMATPNAAGEQVDILNAEEEPSMDIDETGSADSDSEDEDTMTDSIGHLRPPSLSALCRGRLKAIRQEEENPGIRGRKDDIRVQEQVLDLVRNLISEAGPRQPEMIDHLLQAMGSQRLFECLANKLKPKAGALGTTTPMSHRSNPPGATSTSITPAGKRPTLTTPGSTPQQPFPENLYIHGKLLESVIFILIHIANGKPVHRHLLLAQTTTTSPISSTIFTSSTMSSTSKLIDLTIPLFSHPARRIRVACCWLVHNLMWMEDETDVTGAKQRALEMRSRGFQDCVGVCVDDKDLDVRERARGCMDVWARLLRDHGNGAGSGGGGSAGGRGVGNGNVGVGVGSSVVGSQGRASWER